VNVLRGSWTKCNICFFTAFTPKETVSYNSLILKYLISFMQYVVISYIVMCYHCRNMEHLAQITI